MTEAQGELIEAIRRALVGAALQAYEDAGLSGLCVEGRWEVAIDAMRRLDLSRPRAEGAPEPPARQAADPT